MADAAAAEELRQYLLALRPQARALLSEELERTALRGEELPGASTILEQLRDAARLGGHKLPRAGNPQRLFFGPVEPFLVDGVPHRKLLGRIARTSLNPIWQWINRDLMPEEAKTFSDEAQRLLAAKDKAGAEQVARAFQDRVEERLSDRLESAKTDDKAKRRLAVRMGTSHALDDAHELAAILRARDVLTVIASRLPASIGNLGDQQVTNVRALLASPAGHPLEVLPHALLIVRNRLGSPWQLVRLAVHAAGSDSAPRLAATAFAPAVEIALTDLDLMVVALRDALETGDAEVADLLKHIHDTARALRTEIDFPADSAWGRHLAAVRAEAARLLQGEIDALPVQVRRLLRPREGRDSASVLDAGDVAEIEAKVALAAACHIYAGELAISETSRRVQTDLKHYFDSGTQILIDRLRAAPPAERAFRRSQVDAAIRFCGKLFGADDAGVLAKAAGIATRGEKRAAKV